VKFEWDAAKAAANLAKHGVAFDIAPELDWADALIVRQTVRGEDRNAALVPLGDRLHFCAYVVRADVFRIISLRKANTREVRRYLMES
jgi:uncharacterized DUF497 family protein